MSHRVQGNGPWKKERNLKIKNNEQNGDEVITHIEFAARLFKGLEAAFVRRQLVVVLATGTDQKAQADQ